MLKQQKTNVGFRPELTKELKEELEKKGLLTGSTVFGGRTKDSDVDFVLIEDKNFMTRLNPYLCPASGSVNDGCNYQAFYARYKGWFLNLIVVKEQKYFDSWEKAHNLFINLVGASDTFKELAKNKDFRCKQFQLLRDTFGWEDYTPDEEEFIFWEQPSADI